LITSGTTFTFDTGDLSNYSGDEKDDEDDFIFHPEADNYKISFSMPFEEIKASMKEECKYVWKRTYREAKADAPKVEFSRHRVTYHRNLYMENQEFPFDSTWMNNKKPDVIFNDTDQFLPGITDALSTMREGEKAYFVISYKKMFKEEGCPPRVMPKSDILCDLYVTNVEEIGSEESIQQLKEEECVVKPFTEAKTLSKDGRLRAKDFVEQQKYKKAITIYKQILQIFVLCTTSGEDEEKELRLLKIQIMTNIVTCYNLQENAKDALIFIELIEKICDISDNSKLLFAKAKALRFDGEFQRARDLLHAANMLCPASEAIRDESMKLNEAMKKYKELTWKLP
jgi:FK506-binding protein 6